MRTSSSAGSAKLTWAYALGLVVFVVIYRVVPRLAELGPAEQWLWNVTPVGALGLFAGARLRSPLALLLPLAALLVSDLALVVPLSRAGLASFSWGTPVIYSSFALYALLGGLAQRLPASWQLPGVAGACVAGGVQFFLLSNFAAWAFQGQLFGYPPTWAGLVRCYTAALPFYRNTLGGDVLFTAGFFALYFVILSATQREKVSQPA